MTANSTGCTTSTRSSAGAPGAPRSRSSSRVSRRVSASATEHPSRVANTGEVSSRSHGHAGPLRALAGEHERDLAPGRSRCRARRASVLRPLDRGEARRTVRARSPATTAARCVSVGPPDGEGVRDVGRDEIGACAEMCGDAGLGGERGGVLAESTQRPRAGHRFEPCGVGSVGASSTITCALVPLMPNADTAAGAAGRVARPRRRCCSSDTVPADQSTASDGAPARSERGQRLGRNALHHLDHPADPRRGLRMADVRLQRAQPQRPVAVRGRRWPAARRPRSGRRAACRCRGLPRRPCRRRQTGVREGRPDHGFLRRAARCGQPVGRAVRS